MKKFFPNLETLIIGLLIVGIFFWGISRCAQKKADLGTSPFNSPETGVALDTASLTSPAARATKPLVTPPIITPQPLPAADPVASTPQYTPQNQSIATTPPPTTRPSRPMVAPPLPTTTLDNVAAPTASGTLIYVLIDGLNIRVKPELKAKSRGRLRKFDKVFYLDEVTEFSTPVRLITGETVDKPWFKIRTRKGTEGWVHGSGVDFYKRKNN
jgi:Bacterial SH3 domain